MKLSLIFNLHYKCGGLVVQGQDAPIIRTKIISSTLSNKTLIIKPKKKSIITVVSNYDAVINSLWKVAFLSR